MVCVNEGSRSFTCHPHVYPQVKWTIPVFTPQPQSITALCLVLISRPAEGRRLSWPGWLGEILRWFVTHLSTNRARRRATSLIRPATLLLRHAVNKHASRDEYNKHMTDILQWFAVTSMARQSETFWFPGTALCIQCCIINLWVWKQTLHF